MYTEKLSTPDEAMALLNPGDAVMIPFANGIPPTLMEAFASRIEKSELWDMNLFGGLTVRDSGIYNFDLADRILINQNFLGQHPREGTQRGIFTFSPLRLSEFTRAVVASPHPAVMIHQVAPMDEHGFFSTGTNCDYAWEAAKKHPFRRHLILEVNNLMPRTFGNNTTSQK